MASPCRKENELADSGEMAPAIYLSFGYEPSTRPPHPACYRLGGSASIDVDTGERRPTARIRGISINAVLDLSDRKVARENVASFTHHPAHSRHEPVPIRARYPMPIATELGG